MPLRLGLVQINVTDLRSAWDFYVGTLGLRGDWTLGPDHPFELRLEGAGPRVLVYPVRQIARRHYPDETGIVLVFHTDDISITYTDWQAKGITFLPIAWADDSRGIANTPFGTFIAFQDPFGNVHELLEPPS